MYRPRLIPILLLKDKYLVKTTKFKKANYLGDPINAVKLFCEFKADEIILLDISSNRNSNDIDTDLIERVAHHANMPFSYGGGINSLDDIKKVISRGAEKVVLNSVLNKNFDFLKEAVERFGSSTISICLDYKKNIFNNYNYYFNNGSIKGKKDIFEFICDVQDSGVGEIILQDISRDGTMNGYDIDLPMQVKERFEIPFTVLGGAGTLDDMKEMQNLAQPNGIAAGSKFVYFDHSRGVLINYPDKKTISNIFL